MEVDLLTAAADGSGERMLAQRKAVANRMTLLGPAWSPDGKTIAATFLSAENGLHWELTILPATGGTPRTLFSGEARLGRPQWLPDGSGLLVGMESAQQGNRGQLWFVAYPSGEARRFTNDLTNYSLCCLDLTRDGKSLVTIEDSQLSDLWVAPASELSRAVQVTSGVPAGFSSSWFPDGTIVYASASNEIFSVPSRGGSPTLLTPNSRDSYSPSACGDGRSIVYFALSGSRLNVWRMDADGSNPTQLTSGNSDLGPACSPDGKWLAYVSGSDIYRLPLQGGGPTHLASDNYAGTVSISPDGKWIAYLARGASMTSANIRTVIPAGGGAPAYTFPIIAGTGVGHWAPDGRAIDYGLTRGGVTNLWRQPLAGGPPKEITNFTSGLLFSFSWSLDGKHLAMARGSRTSDIILISNFR
jgi:Tol biopolymer transport system component